MTLESITKELLTLTQDKFDPLSTSADDSSFSSTTDPVRLINPSRYTVPHLASTPDRVMSNAPRIEHQPSWPCFTPIESSFSPSADASMDLWKCPVPYEPLFDLSLPKLASLFVERKTAETLQKAGGEREYKEELEGEDLSATSPLEVLDRLIQQGHDVHNKVTRRYRWFMIPMFILRT